MSGLAWRSCLRPRGAELAFEAVCRARSKDRANAEHCDAERKEMDGSMARSRFTFLSSLILVLFVAMVGTLPVRGREAKAAPSVTVKSGEWRYLNGDPMSTRYSPLGQIDKEMGRGAHGPCVRQEDWSLAVRGEYSRHDGEHADDIYGEWQAVHRIHRRHSD